MNITIPEIKDGEKWVGIILKDDGTPDYHLIRLPNKVEGINWKKAQEWAKEQGGEVPNRRESHLLIANEKAFFEGQVYWTSEQHASNDDYAWYQFFGYGGQSINPKSAELCAVAVRRVPI